MEFPILLAILLAPVIGALITIFIPDEEHKIIKVTAAVATFVSMALTVYAFFAYDKVAGGYQFNFDVPWTPDLGVTWSMGVDGISLPMVLLTALIGFGAVYASWDVDKRAKEFFILLLVLIAGVMGTFLVKDLFIFLLFYEVVVIPIYILVILFGSSKRVTKEYAGMKLTIYLLIGSALLLVGVIATYIEAYRITGIRTFDMVALSQVQYSPAFQKFAFLLMALGFGSLLSMFPFHSWSPDGYAGAPTAVSMIHAGVLKKIGGYGMIKIALMFMPIGAKFWAPYLVGLAVVNVVYAALIAIVQKDLKYIVGYSSVSHMGYVVIGIAAMTPIAINGAIATMFAHGIMAALFFAMIGNLYHKTHSRWVPDLGGLAHQMPRVATGFVLAALASAGLPGTVNFIGEYTVFVGAFQVYKWPTIIALTGVVLTAVYVLRAVAYSLYGPREVKYDHLQDARGVEMVPIILFGLVLLATGLLPSILMDLINSGVTPLMAQIGEVIRIGGGI